MIQHMFPSAIHAVLFGVCVAATAGMVAILGATWPFVMRLVEARTTIRRAVTILILGTTIVELGFFLWLGLDLTTIGDAVMSDRTLTP